MLGSFSITIDFMDFSHHPFHIPVKDNRFLKQFNTFFPPVKDGEWITEEKETFVRACGFDIHARISHLSLLRCASQGIF